MTHDNRIDHDRVVESLKSYFVTHNRKVKANLFEERLNPVNGTGLDGQPTIYFPDVFLIDKEAKQVTDIYEVEVSETLNEKRLDRWKMLSNGNAVFYLVVPEEDLAKAKTLAQTAGVPVKDFLTFEPSTRKKEAVA